MNDKINLNITKLYLCNINVRMGFRIYIFSYKLYLFDR